MFVIDQIAFGCTHSSKSPQR